MKIESPAKIRAVTLGSLTVDLSPAKTASPRWTALFGASRSRIVSLASLAMVLGSLSAAQAQIRKADDLDNLNLTTSWIGGVVPGPSDIAQWDSGVTTANSSALGADLSWLGIRILNPGGAIGITGSNILTLGAAGIDMSAATQNLTISSPIVLGAAQSWTVAAGRTLTINTANATTLATAGATGAISGTGPLTLNGAGTVRIGGLDNTTASYPFTGGIRLSGGNGNTTPSVAVSTTGRIAAANLIFDLAAIAPSNTAGASVNFGSPLTAGGGNILTIGGARASGSGATAFIQTGVVAVAAGNTNFSQSRGSSARVINQFSSLTRSVGGTLNLRDNLSGTGTADPNTGGYRAPSQNVNGVIPYITYTTSITNTSWFVSAGTGNNGSAYSAFTSSTANSLGATGAANDTANSTVVTDIDLTGTGANTINTIRFNDATARTITMGAADSLTAVGGGILITNGVANTITGGTLTGGNPGSGSGNDLIVFQYNTAASFQVNSAIADNNGAASPGATALTKSGAGTMVLGGINTYTGPTTVNGGALLINGSTVAASVVTVKNGGTVGGSGTISGPVTLEGGGKVAPGAALGAIGTLMAPTLTLNSNNSASNLTFDLSAADNTSDRLTLSGTLTKGSGSSFLWDFSGGLVGQTYTLATFSSTNFAANDFAIATAGYAGTFAVNANNLTFQLTGIPAVPEPSTWAMLLGGAGMLAGLQRARRRQS